MLPFTVVTNATEGEAEVLFTIAGQISGGGDTVNALLFARLAQYLRPGDTDVALLIAQLLDSREQYDLANAAYNTVSPKDPDYYAAELGRASSLVSAGKLDAAIAALKALAEAHPELAVVWTELGDTQRRGEHFADAVKSYDRAIAILEKSDGDAPWQLYYARGISFERTKQYDKSEADFRHALKIQPNQPQVLNYLGYSFLELGKNLDEAMDMIKRAVAARPDDGYIVDSLGWALYRQGQFAAAVAPMEKAVGLEPVDPIVNDHLGDVYWKVGRQREAEFQWRRALSFNPTPEDATRIRKKLDVGLDAVLTEEAKAPKK